MINTTTNTPDWNTAPDWAKYAAQDPNGEWNWFSRRPVKVTISKEERQWLADHSLEPYDGWAVNPNHIPTTNNRYGFCIAGDTKPNPLWHKTLQKRPDCNTTVTPVTPVLQNKQKNSTRTDK